MCTTFFNLLEEINYYNKIKDNSLILKKQFQNKLNLLNKNKNSYNNNYLEDDLNKSELNVPDNKQMLQNKFLSKYSNNYDKMSQITSKITTISELMNTFSTYISEQDQQITTSYLNSSQLHNKKYI